MRLGFMHLVPTARRGMMMVQRRVEEREREREREIVLVFCEGREAG